MSFNLIFFILLIKIDIFGCINIKHLKRFEFVSQDAKIKRSLTSENALVIYKLNFEAFKRNFNIELKSHDIFSENFKIQSDLNFEKNKFLKGEIKDEKFSWANGYLNNDFFVGKIYSSKDDIEYIIEKYNTNEQYIIYRNIDIKDYNIISSRNSFKNQTSLNIDWRAFRTTQNSDNKICNIFLEVDISYSNFYGSTALGVFNAVSRLAEASLILQSMALKTDNTPSGYKIRVQTIRANDSSQENPTMFLDDVLQADAVMLKFAEMDFTGYCLGVLFLSKPFKDGVAGAAYAGKPESGGGGICSQRYYYDLDGQTKLLNLNVMMITNVFMDQPMYVFQEVRNILHELGHSFGSAHDPSTSSECTPSVSMGGPYLMYPTTPNNIHRNTLIFSKCSRTSIENILNLKANTCFLKTEILCGNFVIDDGEDCDCGDFEIYCQDKCCNPPSSKFRCKLTPGSYCSPQQGKCCGASSCGFLSSSFKCHEESYCSRASYCTGISAVCPKSIPKNEGQSCNKFGNVCLDGTCTGSPCSLANTVECQCPNINSADDYCQLCCYDKSSNMCISSTKFSAIYFNYQTPGSACGTATTYGFCDELGKCVETGTDSTGDIQIKIRDLENVFRLYWLYVLLIAFGASIFASGLYLFFKKRGRIVNVV